MKYSKIKLLVISTLLFSGVSFADSQESNNMSQINIINAVKTLDVQNVSQILKNGYSLKYDNKGWCSFNKGSVYDYAVPMSQDGYNQMVSSILASNAPLIAVPNECSYIPLWTLIRGLDSRSDPSIALIKPALKNQGSIKAQQKVIDMTNLILDNMPDYQYEAYYPLIWSDNVPVELREKALNKFIAAYKNKNNFPPTDVEKQYNDELLKIKTSSPINDKFDFLYSNTNPGLVLLNQLVSEYLEQSSGYDYFNELKKDIYPIYDLSTLKAGGIDLTKIDVSHLQPYQMYRFIQLNGLISMINTLLDSHIININDPDDNGNTVLHLMFNQQNMFNMRNDNQVSYFIDFLLGKGANKTLKNKSGQTPYDIFKQLDNQDYKGWSKIAVSLQS